MFDRRVLGLVFPILFVAGAASADPPKLSLPTADVSQQAKLINITRTQGVFVDDEDLVFYALRSQAGKCDRLSIEVGGVTEERENVVFPWTIVIPRQSKLYPKDGNNTITLRGKSANCTGTISTTFVTAEAKNHQGQGKVTGLRINNYEPNKLGKLIVQGSGMCRIRIMLQPSPWILGQKPEPPPLYKLDYDEPVQLPFVANVVKPLPDGEYTAWVIALDSNDKGEVEPEVQKRWPKYKGCFAQDARFPRRYAVRGLTLTFHTGIGTLHSMKIDEPYIPPKPSAPSNNNNNASNGGGNNSGGGGVPGGGGWNPPPPKPANGKLVSMLVPGGSFAEDEAQRFQVNGQGGCGFDLTISNKTYGGNTEQKWPVLPMKLDSGAFLYNGTHFGTLAEGSWKATTVGTGGCTGTATIDFKVTPKTSTKKVSGKPTLGFDQQPKNGSYFMSSKDGNIWFKVSVPSSIKDEPYATCCDVEYNFKNEYGGWDVIQVGDAAFALAVKQPNAVAPRSVSYFSNGMEWRVKMKGSKFKTEFEWSDWLDFKVDQH